MSTPGIHNFMTSYPDYSFYPIALVAPHDFPTAEPVNYADAVGQEESPAPATEMQRSAAAIFAEAPKTQFTEPSDRLATPLAGRVTPQQPTTPHQLLSFSGEIRSRPRKLFPSE